MLSATASRRILHAVRWVMMFSGALPWILLMTIPSLFIDGMQYQLPMFVLLVAYVFAGIAWSGMEKENLAKRMSESLAISLWRACLIVVAAVVVPFWGRHIKGAQIYGSADHAGSRVVWRSGRSSPFPGAGLDQR